MTVNDVPLDAYLWDHATGIAGVITAIFIAWRQNTGRRKITEIHISIEEVKHDLRNGIGNKIANTVIEQTVPVLEARGLVEAEKIEKKADEVAAALEQKAAWDGNERRSGLRDRRQTKE
jgi:hypothetical protein